MHIQKEGQKDEKCLAINVIDGWMDACMRMETNQF